MWEQYGYSNQTGNLWKQSVEMNNCYERCIGNWINTFFYWENEDFQMLYVHTKKEWIHIQDMKTLNKNKDIEEVMVNINKYINIYYFKWRWVQNEIRKIHRKE